MQRGVLNLSQEELAQLLPIAQSHPFLSSFVEKVQLALAQSTQRDASEEQMISCNREEVESILDALPPPGSSGALPSVRKKLTDFINRET